MLVSVTAAPRPGVVNTLYQEHCAICHGEKGEGGLGSSLIDGNWNRAWTPKQRAVVIRDGIPGTAMDGFSDTLSDEDIRAIVVHLEELRAQTHPVKGVVPKDGSMVTQRATFRLQDVAKSEKKLWGLCFPGENRLLVTEFDGALRFVDGAGEWSDPVANTPEVIRNGQGGLLDVALHPDYANNGWIYLVYAKGKGKGKACSTALVRGKIKGNRWVDSQPLFEVKSQHRRTAGQHFGSRIVFKKDCVYFGIGDRGDGNSAQDLNSPNGKIHRLFDDGRIPEDNPFFRTSEYPSIWSYGHRNPQGLVLHPGTDDLYETEHGPRGGDELNLIVKGANYGWPRITFGINYNGTPITAKTEAPGMTQPVWYWVPSIATCGLAVLDGSHFPGWNGDLFAGGLKGQVLERLRMGSNGELEEREVVLQGYGRVRDVKAGPDGKLYLILEGSGSRIVRIQ